MAVHEWEEAAAAAKYLACWNINLLGDTLDENNEPFDAVGVLPYESSKATRSTI